MVVFEKLKCQEFSFNLLKQKTLMKQDTYGQGNDPSVDEQIKYSWPRRYIGNFHETEPSLLKLLSDRLHDIQNPFQPQETRGLLFTLRQFTHRVDVKNKKNVR